VELDGLHASGEVSWAGEADLHALRHIGVRLALAAMLLRALVPDGWMPVANAANGVTIAICTANGPTKLVVGGKDRPAKQDPAQDPRHVDMCPFSAAPHAATVAPGVPAIGSATAVPYTAPASQPRLAQQASRYWVQSPRAPPVFA
jgi:hypothetical protein